MYAVNLPLEQDTQECKTYGKSSYIDDGLAAQAGISLGIKTMFPQTIG